MDLITFSDEIGIKFDQKKCLYFIAECRKTYLYQQFFSVFPISTQWVLQVLPYFWKCIVQKCPDQSCNG